MVTVPNYKVLLALPSTPEEGEYALVEDEKKVYHGSSELAVDAHIIDEFIKNNFDDTEYFMLMCKDYAKTFYATVFVVSSQITETVGEAVMSCLVNTGTIHEISTEKDHIEIWIKHCDNMYVFMFFPYDFGVVEVM